MRIIVPIKQVPETSAVRMDEETGTMLREGVEAIVNPLDLYSIELAIRLKEEHGAEITAVSMGPPSAAKALREAVAMGCDSAVLVSDTAFAGADTWATAFVLAAAVTRLAPWDLVICGERATDGDTGQVPPETAALLNVPLATYVSAVEDVGKAALTVSRLVEDGYERLKVALPSVITVVKEIASPRLPTLRGKKKARRMDIPVWGPADLGVDAADVGLKGSPTRVVRISRPKLARRCETLYAGDENAVSQAAKRAARFLGDKGLI